MKKTYHARKEYRRAQDSLHQWEARFVREVERRVTESTCIRRARHVTIDGELLGLLRKINRVRKNLRLRPVTAAALLARSCESEHEIADAVTVLPPGL